MAGSATYSLYQLLGCMVRLDILDVAVIVFCSADNGQQVHPWLLWDSRTLVKGHCHRSWWLSKFAHKLCDSGAGTEVQHREGTGFLRQEPKG